MALRTNVTIFISGRGVGPSITVPIGTEKSELPPECGEVPDHYFTESDEFKAKGGADLADLKVSELRKLAEARGYIGLSKKTHEQLVTLLSSEVTDAADL
jgi:hypothetical protein